MSPQDGSRPAPPPPRRPPPLPPRRWHGQWPRWPRRAGPAAGPAAPGHRRRCPCHWCCWCRYERGCAGAPPGAGRGAPPTARSTRRGPPCTPRTKRAASRWRTMRHGHLSVLQGNLARGSARGPLHAAALLTHQMAISPDAAATLRTAIVARQPQIAIWAYSPPGAAALPGPRERLSIVSRARGAVHESAGALIPRRAGSDPPRPRQQLGPSGHCSRRPLSLRIGL